jgi:hypothetical protein
MCAALFLIEYTVEAKGGSMHGVWVRFVKKGVVGEKKRGIFEAAEGFWGGSEWFRWVRFEGRHAGQE